MAVCKDIPVNLIKETEYIGDSLTKINNNFKSLQQGACTIENFLDGIVNVRTFFYYGPNAPVNVTEGTNGYSNDNAASRPSDSTIESFVNTHLNLNNVSSTGDIVYVIYQKTGWYSGRANYVRTGSGSVPYTYSYTVTTTYPIYRKIGINWGKGRSVLVGYGSTTNTYYATAYANYSWTQNLSDQYNFYSPIYIIYKLIFTGTQYVAVPNAPAPYNDPLWPKYVKSQTNSIINWNDPKSWSTY